MSAYFRIQGARASDSASHFRTLGANPVALCKAESILDVQISILIVGTALARSSGGYAMKLQAHLPTVSIGARDWRAAMIALVSLFGASMLLLALQSGVLLNNPLLERLGTSPIIHPHINVLNVPHRVSLDLHLWAHPSSPWERFSVAHSLPANVASSQRFSIGVEARVAFEVFGEAALGAMLADERTVRQFKPRRDRLLLMLMLLRLHTHRH
jgi:hypothetical protein